MRYNIVLALFIAVWSLMVYRLYQISIKSSYYYEKLAKENIERREYLKPVRGEIVDTDGNFLAINRIGFSLSIAPHLRRKKGQLEEVIALIQESFPDINKTVMERVYKKHSSAYNHKHIKVIEFVSYNDMMRAYPRLSITDKIRIDAQTKRHYPYGQYAAHIVGYTGRSNKKENDANRVTKFVGKAGKSGLERYYNAVLQGELGSEITKVDARNRAIEVLDHKNAISNRNIELNLDMKLQRYIYAVLGKRAAAVVVMKSTGEVLSAISNPTYDPNLFVDGISTKNWKALQNNLGHPFTNKFINAVYPPGSVIKMGVALATSKFGKGVLDRHENCNGFINIGKSKHKFRCWSKWGHREVDLRRSIRESCDVYYYNKSLEVGIDNIAKTLKSIGLGIKTGIDLPSEYNGIIPNKEWKWNRYGISWYMGETVIASIGQGYDNITVMQVARHTAFLATDNLVTPMITKKIDGIPVKIESKKMKFNSEHMRQIRLGMYDVCNHKSGTAYKVMHDLPIKVAGKTGTAQVVSIPQDVKKRAKEEDMEYFKRSHAWMTAYAPVKSPEYIVTVLLEHGSHGGSSAGPIVAEIYKWLYYNGYFKEHPYAEVQAELKAAKGIEDDSNTTN